MSTILGEFDCTTKDKTLAGNEEQCLPSHAQSPEGAFAAWQRASCVTLTETRKEKGNGKKLGSLSRKKVDKKPETWLKMKWYDRIHWISSEFKSEVGWDYAGRCWTWALQGWKWDEVCTYRVRKRDWERVAAEDTTVTDGLIATSVVKTAQHGSVRGRTNTQQQPFNTRLCRPWLDLKSKWYPIMWIIYVYFSTPINRHPKYNDPIRPSDASSGIHLLKKKVVRSRSIQL